MGLFRKQPTFKTIPIGLGKSARPVYVKPTKKELEQLKGTGRISLTPHGSAVRNIKVTQKKKRRSTYREAGELANEFRSYQGKSASEFTEGFASSYDSRSALDRNLSFRL